MRHWLVLACVPLVVGACDDRDAVDATAAAEMPATFPPGSSSSVPTVPTMLGATDFCKLVFEAPRRSLDASCTSADEQTRRYRAVATTTRERVQSCWKMLSQGVQHKRLALPVVAAQRCASALESLPWHQALESSLADVPACRNIASGLSGTGKPCRTALECGPDRYCSRATAEADGVCTQQVTSGNACQASPWQLFDEPEVACTAGFFCDHADASNLMSAPSSPRFPHVQSQRSQRLGPKVRATTPIVSGRLPSAVVRRVVRSRTGRFRLCYETGLRTNPSLAGTVRVHFVISSNGSVGSLTVRGVMGDSTMVACVKRAFATMAFPQPEAGTVTVRQTIRFGPRADSRPPPAAKNGGLAPMEAPTNTCIARRKQGDRCRAGRECADDLVCALGRCGKPLEPGAECHTTAACKGGLRCLAEPETRARDADDVEDSPSPPLIVRRCKVPKAPGASCASDAECAGACVAGACAAFCEATSRRD